MFKGANGIVLVCLMLTLSVFHTFYRYIILLFLSLTLNAGWDAISHAKKVS